MKIYTYKAIDRNNVIHNGELKAINVKDILQKLFDMRLDPIEIVEKGKTDLKLDKLKKIKDVLTGNVEKPEIKPSLTPKNNARNYPSITAYQLFIIGLTLLAILAYIRG